MKMSGYVISNVGVKKYSNEDNYLINNLMNETSKSIDGNGWNWKPKNGNFCYAAVFDGMGGGSCGQWAAKAAADEFRRLLEKVQSRMTKNEIDKLVKDIFLNANRRIVEERKKHSVLGTTATLLCIVENRAKLYYLGDSRGYLYRENRLMQLTKDQTMANLKIEAGIYAADAPEAEKDKYMLTEYLGADETMTSICPMESGWVMLRPKDRLLLCSDGLYHFCEDKEIKDVIQYDRKPEELADCLVCKALEKGGTDNITCLVVSCEEVINGN